MNSTVIYISPDWGDDKAPGSPGSPMKTLPAAITRGGEGVTLVLGPGEYGCFDPLVGVNGLTLVSADVARPARFGGDPAKHALCIRGAKAWDLADITLDGVEFHDALDGLRPIASRAIVTNCRFQDLGGQGVLWTAMDAKGAEFGKDLWISHCLFERIGRTDAHDHPIYVAGDRITVQECLFQDCPHGAPQISPAAGRVEFIRNIIRRCRVGLYARAGDLSRLRLVGNVFGPNLLDPAQPPVSTWEKNAPTWRDPNDFGFANTWRAA